MSWLPWFDVYEFNHNSVHYPKINSIRIQKRRGQLHYITPEGEEEPTIQERMSLDNQPPVSVEVQSDSLAVLIDLLNADPAAATVRGRYAGDAQDHELTFDGLAFVESSLNASRNADGQFSIRGSALDVTGAQVAASGGT